MGTKEELFKGVVALFLEPGVKRRQLEVWKNKLQQKGGVLRNHINRTVTHIFAIDIKFLEGRVGREGLKKLRAIPLKYEWLEDCLISGHCIATEPYMLQTESKSQFTIVDQSNPCETISELRDSHTLRDSSPESGQGSEDSHKRRKVDDFITEADEVGGSGTTVIDDGHDSLGESQPRMTPYQSILSSSDMTSQEGDANLALSYSPPNLNKNITNIFNELKNICGDALGDDRRSHSYHKAIQVLEKVPFKITSAEQVKELPSIGKSLYNHIAEILETGTSAKLEHFKEDEKVNAVSKLSSVWGIGHVTAQKLYEKGHRTLEDLKSEKSLSSAQKLGLKFLDDINTKIPRHEVQIMEGLVQKMAKTIDPDVSVVCGGSYRRGKALVGDIDIVITHPDGESHPGFLGKLVQKLKEIDFITEDLQLRSDHSTSQETGRAVDTYFGLCKYPGRELRHRIDIKVYPIEKYPFGLIAWTGNDVLNRKLRILADKKGYRLDDHGLFPLIIDADGNKVANRRCGVHFKTEEEVFDFIGHSWLEPHERNL